MKQINVPVGIFVGLLTLMQIALGHELAAVATGLLAAGLFLSDLAYVATPGKFVTGPLLTAHNLASILRVGASLGLFGYQAGRGLRQATYQ